MKKTIKLFTVLTIVLAMVLAFVPANSFAATLTLTNGTITVDTTDSSTRSVTLYKLFNITSATDTNDYSYSFANNDVKAYFTGIGKTNIVDAISYVNGLATDPALNAFALAIKNSGITGTTQNSNVAFTNQTSGYYLLVDNTTVLANGSTISAVVLDNVVFTAASNTYEVDLKIDTIEAPVLKVADNDDSNALVDWDSALPGESLTFTITQVIPTIENAYTSYEMNIIDTLPAGLVYDDTFVPTVKIGDTDLANTYTVSADNKTLTWKFNDISDIRANAGETITITYKANVATTGFAQTNTNSVVTTYTENPNATTVNGTTATDTVDIYCYELNLSKKNATGALLDGAVFTLTGPDAFSKNVTVTGGSIIVAGLKEGEYTLTETTAPEGYTLLDMPLKFTITDKTTEGGSIAITKTATAAGEQAFIEVEVDSTDTLQVNVDVLNVKFGALPSTGGVGTVIFTVIGLSVMAGAVIVLVKRNKKSEN